MLSEELLAATRGPPISPNTSVAKDVGIYSFQTSPWAGKATFKKSSAPLRGVAVGATHVFAAQDQKAHVHVYARSTGQQEALVSFEERIRCVALAGDNVVVLGTAEGRLVLWETCTGRTITTPACHLQAVTCLAVSPYHLLSASDDSNINVWSLARLLELGATDLSEPNLTLTHHRGPVTDLVLGGSTNPHTLLCVSASQDKTCILWNYHSGQVLRTLLFSSVPQCIAIHPAGTALVVAAADAALYLVEFFGQTPLLGAHAAPASTVVHVEAPLATGDAPALCLALSFDGSVVYTGHATGDVMRWNVAGASNPVSVVNVNAAVTNLVFPPLLAPRIPHRPVSVVKPHQAQREYTVTTQLLPDAQQATPFLEMLGYTGMHPRLLEPALLKL